MKGCQLFETIAVAWKRAWNKRRGRLGGRTNVKPRQSGGRALGRTEDDGVGGFWSGLMG